MKWLIVLAFVATALANDGPGPVVKKVVSETKHVSYGDKGYYGDKAVGYTSAKTYHGKYPGACGNDGFYYNDAASFVICSNGNAYVQPCAPGSKNSGYDKYEYGGSYQYRDFCDINLVDDGYGVKYGYKHGGYYPEGGYAYNSYPSYGLGGYGPARPYDGYAHGKPGYAYNAYDGYYGNYGLGGYQDKGYRGYQKTEYTKYEAPRAYH